MDILASTCILIQFLLIVEQSNSWVLYISTDYVFDGKSAPYDVDAQPNPLNKYGQMKYEGEKRVLASNPGLCHLWCYIRELTSTT